MLVLSRKANERIFIGKDVIVEVICIEEGGRIKLGITAPPSITILREELIRPDQRDRFACSNDC